MKVKVKLTAYDLLADEETVLADGAGLLVADTLKYTETQEQVIHSVTFTDETVILKRRAEITSTTTLHLFAKGEAMVESEYGTMSLSTKTFVIDKKENRWIVEYAILSDEEPVTHQRLTWQIEHFN